MKKINNTKKRVLRNRKKLKTVSNRYRVSVFRSLKNISAPDVTKDFLLNKINIFLKLVSLINFLISSVELTIYFINCSFILIKFVGLGSFFILLLPILTSKKLRLFSDRKSFIFFFKFFGSLIL